MTGGDSACILVVEAEILVRHPLAEYLRGCGYRVVEAVDAAEARRLIEAEETSVGIVLAASGASENGFALPAWLRSAHPGIAVIRAGSVARAAEKAADLCEDGPAVGRPYDHAQVLDRIQRLIAARARAPAG